MKYTKIIKIDSEILSQLNSLLSGETKDYLKNGEILHTVTAKFPERIEVDIKLVQGEPPYVDAVIFHNGNEIFPLEPEFEQYDGSYEFNVDENTYIVIVKENKI